jgi:antitoxin HicB
VERGELRRAIAAYLARPYHLVIQAQPEGEYGARVAELPNCIAAGSTPGEALAMLRDAMEGWLLVSLESGDDIPEPAPDLPLSAALESSYSGKFLLRVPRSVHRQLAERAAQEDVSLNQLVLSYVSRGLGADTGG